MAHAHLVSFGAGVAMKFDRFILMRNVATHPLLIYLNHHVNIINNDRLQILINEGMVRKTYESKTKVVKNTKNLN